MKTYCIGFRYSVNGNGWIISSSTIKAESQAEAIRELKSRYNYIKDIKVKSVH